jgi:hypothetical protein
MRKHLFNIIVFLLPFLITFCGGKKEESAKTPSNILSPEKFTRVLKDFALAESAVSLNIKNVGIGKLDSAYAFDPLKENNVSKAEYDSTVTFYTNHPELYKKIYEAVLDSLSKMQSQRNSLKKDSVHLENSPPVKIRK